MKFRFCILLLSVIFGTTAQASQACQDIFKRTTDKVGSADTKLIKSIVNHDWEKELPKELLGGWIRGLFEFGAKEPFKILPFEFKPILIGKSKAGHLVFLAPKSKSSSYHHSPGTLTLVVARDTGFPVSMKDQANANSFLNWREGEVFDTVSNYAHGKFPFILNYDAETIVRYGTLDIEGKLFFFGTFGFRKAHGYRDPTVTELKELLDKLLNLN